MIVVYGYVRVSSEKQAEMYGPEVQADAIRAFCSKHQLPSPDIRSEAETGKNIDRAVLQSIFTDAEQDVAVGDTPICVIYRLDRLSRMMMDTEALIVRSWSIKLRLRCCDESEDRYLDPATAQDPMVKLVRRIMAAFVEYERDRIQGRFDSGIKVKGEKGGFVGASPTFGYTIKDRDLVPDPEKVPVIRKLLELHDNGWSHDAIVVYMKEHFPKTPVWSRKAPKFLVWSRTAVARILANEPLYRQGLYRDRYTDKVANRPDLVIA